MCPFLIEVDSYKLAAWAVDEAEPLDVRKAWTASMKAEHRKAGSELGLDYGSRARISSGGNPAADDPGEDFFNGR